MSLKRVNALVEQDLVRTNNKITKQSRLSIIDSAIETVSSEKVFDINNAELSFIKSLNCLDENELAFLSQMVGMPSEIKERLKSDNIMNMLPLIPVITKKLEKAKSKLEEKASADIDSLNERLNHLKVLIAKLNKNDINLISEIDIDLLVSIFNESKLPSESQIDVLKSINQLNYQIFSNYDIQLEKNNELDEDTIDIDQLDETNIEYIELEKIFKKYSINWEEKYAKDIVLKQGEDINNNSTYKQRMLAIKEYKAKLLKYGHLGKIEELLGYLRQKNLTFVFNQPEIITKILLSSTKDNIDRLINEFGNNNLNWRSFMEKYPTSLFPNSKMTIKIDTGKSRGRKSTSGISGSLNYCLKNIEFLKERGFDVEQVMDECPIFFERKPSTQERIYDKLRLYGFSFKNPDGTTKKGFSVLNTLDALDKIDAGIECGCYAYYLDNISKVVPPKFNIFKIKLAKMNGIEDRDIFRRVKSPSGGTKIVLNGTTLEEVINPKYGDTIEETFAIYKAIDVTNDNSELYDAIVANSNNDTITDFVVQDEYIKQLDQLYLENKLTYNFNGVLISRFKVLRYYQTLITNPNIDSSREALMYVITKNSMLNQSDYNNICICLDKINFNKNVKIKGEKK